MDPEIGEALLPASVSGSMPAADHDSVLLRLPTPPPIRITSHLWCQWLKDPATVARFEMKRYRRTSARCWFYTGAISSTGHGSFRAASLPGRSRRGTVQAHLFAYQLEFGIIPRLGWTDDADTVLCHRCDAASCTNPAHLRLGTAAENSAEWASRRRDPSSPLADTRGPAGRARAISAAIRLGIESKEDHAQIEARIDQAIDAGRPLTLW